MRTPGPRFVQELPSGEYSKVVRQTSGLLPPRVQVRFEPSKVKRWVADPVLLSRPMKFRLCPPTWPKNPPTRIFPSACNARETPALPPPGSKLGSTAPSEL